MEENWEDASLRRLIDELPDLVCRFVPDGKLLYVNHAYAAFHGRCPEEMVGRRFPCFVEPDLRPAIESALEAMRSTPQEEPVRRNTHQSRSASGELHWHEWTDRAFFDDAGTLVGFMSIGRDMTELLARHSAVEHDLIHDHLTGVRNRRGVLASLGDRLIHAERDFLVGYLDIDDFKRVNDLNGHSAGDAILIAVADALRSLAPDGLVGRIGGDEFVVIIGDSAEQGGAALDSRLDSYLAAMSPRVTVSCGWVVASPGETADTVLRQADAAMYDRKRRRRLSA